MTDCSRPQDSPACHATCTHSLVIVMSVVTIVANYVHTILLCTLHRYTTLYVYVCHYMYMCATIIIGISVLMVLFARDMVKIKRLICL